MYICIEHKWGDISLLVHCVRHESFETPCFPIKTPCMNVAMAAGHERETFDLICHITFSSWDYTGQCVRLEPCMKNVTKLMHPDVKLKLSQLTFTPCLWNLLVEESQLTRSVHHKEGSKKAQCDTRWGISIALVLRILGKKTSGSAVHFVSVCLNGYALFSTQTGNTFCHCHFDIDIFASSWQVTWKFFFFFVSDCPMLTVYLMLQCRSILTHFRLWQDLDSTRL